MIRTAVVSLCRAPPVSFCLLITFAAAWGSVLDLVKHTFICLWAVSSDTLLCQHMACPRVLNSSSAQMLVARCLSAFLPEKMHHIRKDCFRNRPSGFTVVFPLISPPCPPVKTRLGFIVLNIVTYRGLK